MCAFLSARSASLLVCQTAFCSACVPFNASSYAALCDILCASVLFKYSSIYFIKMTVFPAPVGAFRVRYIAGISYVGLSLMAIWSSDCLAAICASISFTDCSSSGCKKCDGTGILANLPSCAIILCASFLAFINAALVWST